MSSFEDDHSESLARKRSLFVVFVLACFFLHFYHSLSYFFVCDDAFISFRYAQNFLLGRGLVFNPGDYVEGYTNFLWVLQLTAADFIGIPPQSSSLLLSIVYTIGAFAVTVQLGKQTCFRRQQWWAIPLALLFLALNRSYSIWSTGGLETRSNTFFLLAGIWGMLEFRGRGKAGFLIPAIAFSAAVLTRPDSLLIAVTALTYNAVISRHWVPMLKIFLTLGIVVALQTAFRLYYYGDVVPNTYYAKVGVAWWDIGFAYVSAMVIEYGLWLILPLVGLFARRGGKPAARELAGLTLLLFALQALYQARIGGDHFEYRPFDIFWPLFSVVLGGIIANFSYSFRKPWNIAAPAAAVALIFVYSTAMPLVAAKVAEPIQTRGEATLRSVEITAEDAGVLRFAPGWMTMARLWYRLSSFSISHASGVRWFEHRINADYLLDLYMPFDGLRAEGSLPHDAVTKAGAVGIIAYFTDMPVVDLYGLTDKVIAKSPSANDRRMIAHNHEAPPGYLEEKGVNIEQIFIWQTAPQSYSGYEELYFVKLKEGVVLSFISRDPAWVEDTFAGRILSRPSNVGR